MVIRLSLTTRFFISTTQVWLTLRVDSEVRRSIAQLTAEHELNSEPCEILGDTLPSMASKKKNKARSTAKAKKLGQPVNKVKTSRKPAQKQTSQARPGSKPKAKRAKKPISVSAEKELKREFRGRNLEGKSRASVLQSDDFAGVSRAEQANSESVAELVQEGNLFEAGAVAGVQEADNADEKEVHTRELPEDDVPEEYLDKD